MDPNDQDRSRPPTMVAPFGSTPPGLECLIPINKLMIVDNQNFGPMNPLGFKQYNILDPSGSFLFLCTETRELIRTECCCKERDTTSIRPWTIEAFNGQDTSILTGSRSPLKHCCCSMKYDCQVSFSSGLPLGGIYMVFKPFKDESTLKIVDASGTPVLRIKAQMHTGCEIFCPPRCHEFPVMTMDKQLCGMITWYSDSVLEPSRFGVEFPADLDVNLKALLIYATIMIEFYYVQSVRQHRRKGSI